MHFWKSACMWRLISYFKKTPKQTENIQSWPHEGPTQSLFDAYLGGLKVYCKCPPVLKGPRQGRGEEKEAQVQKG